MAAPTTSLPERIGGVRNWDYRFCWLRDATLTLRAMLAGGYLDEALAWRGLAAARDRRRPGRRPDHVRHRRRTAAGRTRARLAARLRRLEAGARRQRRIRPVPARRVRRADRRRLPDRLVARRLRATRPGGRCCRLLLRSAARTVWRQPDAGIWEVRGPNRHFTYSKVMSWVAFDRAVAIPRGVRPRRAGRALAGRLRDEIHAQVCSEAWCDEQAGVRAVLRLRATGRQRAADTRSWASCPPTTRAWSRRSTRSERELMRDGLCARYLLDEDGTWTASAAGEGVFLACSFWLADVLAVQGRIDRGRASCSSGCSTCETTSACCPRSTTLSTAASWATCRRRSRTWRWSAPRSLLGQGDQLRGGPPNGWPASHHRVEPVKHDRPEGTESTRPSARR